MPVFDDEAQRVHPVHPRRANHLINIGPKGGSGGGHIVATGTPEEVVKVKVSYTG